MSTDKGLFDLIRERKGAALTQADVEAINSVIGKPAATKSDWQIGAAGVALIHSFESLRLKAYPDPDSKNGLPVTNGWGTTVDEDGKPITLGAIWTKEKADRLWLRDQKRFVAAVNKLVAGFPTTQAQFDALVSFAYNVGEGADGLGGSTLLRKHRSGDFTGARAEFARWNKNDGKVSNGLIRRRAAEAELYAGRV